MKHVVYFTLLTSLAVVVVVGGCAHLPKGTVGIGITYSTPIGGK